jgi:hypothetical protein
LAKPLFDSDIDFDPIEDVEDTGEIKYSGEIMDNRNDFINYINCTMDVTTSFDFNSLIKSNLNNLIQFINSFQNFNNQTTDYFQQAILIFMRKHFEKYGIILNYSKWDRIF